MSRVTMVTGGGRSGKSSFALGLAMKYRRRAFIATAEPFDAEMKSRIGNHRKERGRLFKTIEEPLDLAGALAGLDSEIEVVLIDCITVWIGNLMHHFSDDKSRTKKVADFIASLERPPCDVIVVTNEVGSGIIPGDRLSRIFRDEAGRLNQSVARLADEVHLVVSGIPVRIKG